MASSRAACPRRAAADNLIVAYEPVWAIGTGRTPSLDDIARTHAHLRALVAGPAGELGLLYGGSVKASNAGEILARRRGRRRAGRRRQP